MVLFALQAVQRVLFALIAELVPCLSPDLRRALCARIAAFPVER